MGKAQYVLVWTKKVNHFCVIHLDRISKKSEWSLSSAKIIKITQHVYSDFGDDAEQILLVMESLLGNGGHFLSKDFSTRLLNYSKTGIKNLLKKPTNMNATNEAVLANPTYQVSPVRKNGNVILKEFILIFSFFL